MSRKPYATHSGDLTADRRADYAEMLFGAGDPAGAAEVMMGALELAPGWALGWARLGEFHEAARAMAPAIEAWRMAARIDAQDHAGTTLKLALVGAESPPDRPPGAFVETLFDQYAERFDKALVEGLAYRVPDLLEQAIRVTGRERFELAFDLGCGTGLMGERLRPFVARLEGFDLSEGMLAKARAKGIYDGLAKADLHALSWNGRKADLVTAADVFMYVGALEGVFAAIADAAAPGGLFAFSVERHDGPEDLVLRDSRRYAHGQSYLERLLAAHGFVLLSLETAVIRRDRNAPVEGMIVVAQRG